MLSKKGQSDIAAKLIVNKLLCCILLKKISERIEGKIHPTEFLLILYGVETSPSKTICKISQWMCKN